MLVDSQFPYSIDSISNDEGVAELPRSLPLSVRVKSEFPGESSCCMELTLLQSRDSST